ncbi:DUF2846 domain-containing protein [Spirosoma sp. HMF4905]|uniref:DUF2846 domain-containing protein n=1 Tax=Spirosoma arboris TaxID=2682092 RepID=A0A7K1SPA5_9BACT|nr:DUF2846 domain-containing protein [Spirosoma arboris]MVM35503.1 DUF2846 domain-containing protein [Spirosoma arboris]
MKTLLLSWLSSLLLLNHPHSPNQPVQAQLILYREKEFISGLGKAFPFKINDKKTGKLSPNHYIQLPLAPGRIKIEFYNDYFTDSRPLWIQVESGQTYYVKAVVEVDFWSSMMLMAPMPAQQALPELRRMKPEAAHASPQPE